MGKFYNTKLEAEEDERQRKMEEDRRKRQEEGRLMQEKRAAEGEKKLAEVVKAAETNLLENLGTGEEKLAKVANEGVEKTTAIQTRARKPRRKSGGA